MRKKFVATEGVVYVREESEELLLVKKVADGKVTFSRIKWNGRSRCWQTTTRRFIGYCTRLATAADIVQDRNVLEHLMKEVEANATQS